MASFNSFLLSIFAKNVRFGSDVPSMIRRYQILSTLYVNIALLLLIMSYDLLAWLAFSLHDAGFFLLLASPFFVTILILLLNGYHDGAAMVLFPYMHAINFSASYYRDYHMSAALAIMVFTHFSFFLSVPSKFRNKWLFLCGRIHLLYFEDSETFRSDSDF